MIVDHGFRPATAGPGCSYPVSHGAISGEAEQCGALEEGHERLDVEYVQRNADLSVALTAAAPRRLDTRRIEHELRVLEDQLVHEQEYLQRTQYDTSSDVWLLKLAVDDVKRARENLVVRRMLWIAQHPDNAGG